MSVFFHGNFGLNRPRMAKVFELLCDDPSISDKEIAKSFGYGPPFAAIYRSWLHKVGFIEQGKPFTITKLGRDVRESDPLLEHGTTVVGMHEELSSGSTDAEAWLFFSTEFREKKPMFDRNDLESGLVEKLRYHSEMHFGPSSKMIPIIARKLLQCYLESEALGSLEIIVEVEPGKYQFRR